MREVCYLIAILVCKKNKYVIKWKFVETNKKNMPTDPKLDSYLVSMREAAVLNKEKIQDRLTTVSK